jgi:hypothetical protein
MHCNAIGFSHHRPLWRSIILLYISMSNEGFLRPSESIINGDEQFMTYAEKEMRIALGLGSVQRNMLSKRHMSSSGTQEYGFAPSPSSLCRHLSALISPLHRRATNSAETQCIVPIPTQNPHSEKRIHSNHTTHCAHDDAFYEMLSDAHASKEAATPAAI